MTELYQDVIALLTDFGLRGSHYVASMKGVILKINPNVKIVDIAHMVSPYSIIEASYLIKSSYRYFPEYTVFILVIDPGVGSSRNILALETESHYYFVGPDNGLFPNILFEDEIEECVIVNNENYFVEPVSQTFHGRDIMAPVGAYITNGIPLPNFGSYFNPKKFVHYPIKYELKPKEHIIECTIQYVDSFGNITTNIPIKDNLIRDTEIELYEGKSIIFSANNKEIKGIYASHFADVPKKNLLFLKGSSNFLEISINQGNAAENLNVSIGDIIIIDLK